MHYGHAPVVKISTISIQAELVWCLSKKLKSERLFSPRVLLFHSSLSAAMYMKVYE